MKSKIALAFHNCKKEKRPALIVHTRPDNTSSTKFVILLWAGKINQGKALD